MKTGDIRVALNLQVKIHKLLPFDERDKLVLAPVMSDERITLRCSTRCNVVQCAVFILDKRMRREPH